MNEAKSNPIRTNGVNGVEVTLRFCPENLVKKAVIEKFIPIFAPQSSVIYLKAPLLFKAIHCFEKLESIGIFSTTSGSLPDIVLLDEKRGWVFFIEAVHSFGPISPQRLMLLEALCTKCQLPLVFVTAFLDRNAFRKFAPEIAWETEVWIAQEPDHMIHFNGDRFFGPRRNTSTH